MRTRCRLQAMLEAIDGEAAAISLQHLQVGEYAIGQLDDERLHRLADAVPVFLRAVAHRMKACARHVAIGHGSSESRGWLSSKVRVAGADCQPGVGLRCRLKIRRRVARPRI